MKRKGMLFVIGSLLICSIFLLTGYIVNKRKSNNPNSHISEKTNNLFDYNFSKESLLNDDNSLVSPVSIAYLLSMIKSGAKGNTLKELELVLNNYNLTPLINTDEKVSMANSIWIKNGYKDAINKEYVGGLKINYRSDIMYDDFNGAANINNWVKEKTYDMIDKLFDDSDITPNTIMTLVNAIAINLKWEEPFNCNSTTMELFNEKENVYMMHSTEDYLESDYFTGFVKTYESLEDETQFEFIGLLPKNNVNEVIDNLSNDVLKKSRTNDSAFISIPRFKYDYDVDYLKKILNKMGINDLFSEDKADLSGISNGIYVSVIKQKTYIDFMETGTKAAAASGATFDKNSPAGVTSYEVNFNKPFVYIIKEKNSDNIYFIGVVNKPTIYDENNNICEE